MHFRTYAVLIVLAITVAQVQAATVNGDPAAAKTKVTMVCGGCHGVDGNLALAMTPPAPKLAGQIPEYLYKQLQDFKSRTRVSPVMNAQAASLSDKDMQNLAAYFASQTPQPGAATTKELAEAGGKLYRGGNAKTGVSACMSCHGPSGHGIPPRFPRVSGQSAAYTEKQLLDFKAGDRKNDQGIMTRIAFRMSLDEIHAVSQYMAGLH